MKVSRPRIAQAVAHRALEGEDPKQLSRELAAYLLSEGRASELQSVLRDVQADWQAAGYVEVIATAAHPLTSETAAQIRRRIGELFPSAKQVIVTEQRDEAVVGGVRLSLANQQLDLSVETKLNHFKQLTGAGKE